MEKLNNAEREQWINNDEGLYNWYNDWKRRNRDGIRGFIKENRQEIDAAILGVIHRYDKR